jgi:hypothetical protein
VPIVISAVAAYAVNLREARANDALDSYWATGFPSKSASVFGAIRWIPGAAWRALDQPGGVGHRWLALLLIVAGVVAFRRRGRSLGVGVWGVVALTLLAGAVRLFPVRGRLVLFLVPLLAIALSAALAHPWLRWFAGVALVILLVGPAGDLVDVARHPPALVEGREAMEFVARHRRPGDLVFVHSTAVPSFDFYAEQLDLRRDGVVGPVGGPATCRPTEKPRAGRAWLVFAYTLSTRPGDENARVGAWFGDGALPRRAFRGEDASARLYDLTADPWPTAGCWMVS